MGQYYHVITKDNNGQQTVYNMQTTKFTGDNFREYNGLKLMEHSYWKNPFCVALAEKLVDKPMRVCWCGDYAEEDEAEAVGFKYSDIWSDNAKEVAIEPSDFDMDSVAFLVNKTKGEYIDLKKYYKKSVFTAKWKDESWDMCIFPIALLTALGNDRGGGDYHEGAGTDFDKVGRWAFDEIYLTNSLPENLTELEVMFKENR